MLFKIKFLTTFSLSHCITNKIITEGFLPEGIQLLININIQLDKEKMKDKAS